MSSTLSNLQLLDCFWLRVHESLVMQRLPSICPLHLNFLIRRERPLTGRGLVVAGGLTVSATSVLLGFALTSEYEFHSILGSNVDNFDHNWAMTASD